MKFIILRILASIIGYIIGCILGMLLIKLSHCIAKMQKVILQKLSCIKKRRDENEQQ